MQRVIGCLPLDNVDFENKTEKSARSDYASDDEYLRSIDGMVQSIQEARREPDCKGVAIDKLTKLLTTN